MTKEPQIRPPFIRAFDKACRDIGITRSFYREALVAHWGAPAPVRLPGKPSAVKPRGRGRDALYMPDVLSWFYQLAEQQGIEIQNKIVLPTAEQIAAAIGEGE